jgi:H+-transporting ATPase
MESNINQPEKPDTHPNSQDDLKSLPLEEVKKKLGASPDGLTQTEAQKRLAQYGPNKIEEKKTNPFLKFLSYFWGPIPWMIEVAVILSAVAQHWPDFCIILLLLVGNAVVGFWEEHQAGNAIEALKAKLASKTQVKRDGKWTNPAVSELVPGDVIHLRLGDIVPADGRLLEGDQIEADQSALTGESLPVTHKSGDAVFSGSIIRTGEIDALVYATGSNTYFGKTAQLVQGVQTPSHFQQAVLKIGNYLIILAVVLVAVIIIVALFRGDPVLTTLQFALVLTVAAIPVSMPTVLSVTMAVGARLLAAKEVIVTRMAAIEELAGVDILCADKTGTLTQNKLTLGDPFCVEGISADQVILNAALASRADNNDTIDLAVLGGLNNKDALNGFEVIHFMPFDPVHKRTEATIKGQDGNQFKVTKGAPQVILELSANAEQVKSAVDKAVNDFAARGFRSLGVARADGDGPWQFIGVLPMSDPPREEAQATIATAREMGVKIKMVTGDQMAIAQETARTLGMGANILDASGFGDTKHHETGQLADSIENADGFAQVFPEHKFHIIDVLQQRGHIVGMTGDGVNDAPALKKSDCGIAVSGATDAARAAASIVLMAPGLTVIVDAIKESRKIFQRMNSYAIYRIAETIGVLIFMTLSILIFNFYPLTAVMIVMLALLNDGAILSIAYDNVHYKNTPESWNMHMVLGVASVVGIIGVADSFGLFYLGERVFHLDHAMIQTLIYLKLSVSGHFKIFQTRTRGPFWSIRPARILLVAVVSTQIIATLVAVYGVFMPAIGWRWALMIWGYSSVWFLFNDRVKLLAYRIFDPVKAETKPDSKGEDKPEAKEKSKPDIKLEVKPESKTEAKLDAKDGSKQEAKPETKAADSKPEAKVEQKQDSKAESKPQAQAGVEAKPSVDPKPEAKAKTTSDLTPQIAARAYELYEEHGHQEGQSVQNWDKAEREIREADIRAEPEAKAAAKPEGEVEPKPEARAETKPENKVEPKVNTPTDLTPQLVNRVHQLYEDLGREEVRAVEELEKAERESRKDKPDK